MIFSDTTVAEIKTPLNTASIALQDIGRIFRAN